MSHKVHTLHSPVFTAKIGEPRPRRTFKQYMKKYFLDGQQLEEVVVVDPNEEGGFLDRHRKYIAFIIPFVMVQTFWWLTALRHNWLPLFATRWQMPLTMILGSTVAGMTSEGGGAVAFPVMTLVLHIDADTARDFSLMIQSFGMTSAMFVLLFMRVKVENDSILCATLGSLPGMILGFEFLDPLLSGTVKKMLFVSIWGSFAIALFILNRHKKRVTFPEIPEMCAWKRLALVCTGFMGGVFTSFAGSGVDICTFSILTLLFRVTEKTATPTTVVIMGMNSLVGFYWRGVWQTGITNDTWEWMIVSIPVAATCAPLGSFLGSHLHRMVLAWFVYILEILSLIGFLITAPPVALLTYGAFILAAGLVFFSVLSFHGSRLADHLLEGRRREFVASANTCISSKISTLA